MTDRQPEQVTEGDSYALTTDQLLAWARRPARPVPMIRVFNLNRGLPGGVLPSERRARVIEDPRQLAAEMATMLAVPIERPPVQTRPVEADLVPVETAPRRTSGDSLTDISVTCVIAAALFAGIILPITTYWILGKAAWDELRDNLGYLQLIATVTIAAVLWLIGRNRRR